MKQLHYIVYVWLMLFLAFTTTLFANTQIDSGKVWLADTINQQAVDVNSSHLALATQSSKETLLAMQMLSSISDLNEDFVLSPFEVSLEENSTEYLAAKITSFETYGRDTASLVQSLLSLQNSDGGFGSSKGYQSTLLDTALALETLSQVTVAESTISKAVNYLMSKQQANGSWTELLGDETNYTTAVVMRALWLHRKSYEVLNNLIQANTYLSSVQNADGSYGETFITALVLKSIAPLHYDKTSLQKSIDHLKSTQQASGSWEEDIYTTALVLQALLVADKEVPNPDLATLSGLVVDGDSGIALSNITVEMEGISTVATDSNGRFAFAGLQNASYTLHITSDNHAPLHTIVRMVGDDIDLGTLRLNKNADAMISTLQGVIKDQQSGEPLSGVTVSIGDSTTVTDSSGSYTIDSIEAGSYILVLKKDGYIQKQQSITVPANTLLYYNATLNTIDFTAEATIQGTIVDKNTSIPLEGVLVELTGATTKSITTTNDGSFVFSKVGQGQYDIKITKEGYRTQVANVQIDESKVIDFGIVTLDMADPTDTTVLMRGTITEAQTNIPLQGALISVGTSTTYSNSSGNYELTDLDAGILNIEVSKDGYNSVSAQANAVAGSIISFSPSLQKIDANLSIYGTIFDENNSEPLEYVKVEYSGESNGTVYTDDKGYYVITPVQSGEMTLSYSKVGYEAVVFSTSVDLKSINISPSLTPIENSNLINNATLQGVVLDLITKEPIEGVNISVSGLQTNTTITSDTDGLFMLSEIASYDLNLTFTKDGYKETSTTIYLFENEEFDMGPVSMRPISDKELYPDLVVSDTDLSQATITQEELTISGNMNVVVSNQGGVSTDMGFDVLAFYDVNSDGNYSEQIDLKLGESNIDTTIGVEQNATVLLTLSGELPYVNAPISVWVDSSTRVFESDETNNIIALNKKCGVVSTVFTTSYQAKAIKEAIVKGSDYIAPQTMSWDRRNRCLGCHIQTQTLVGLQASMAKAEVDTVTGEYLLAKILSSQQSNGSILNSHSYWPKTQTGYALWSLSYVPDANRTFNVRANALRLFNQTKSTSNGRIYWTPEYTGGWLDSTEILTSIVAFGTSRYLKDAKTQETLDPLEEDMVRQYTALLPQITRYLLDRASSLYNSNDSNNMRMAIIMLGLGELRRHVTDQSLYQEVDQMIKNLEQRLRGRQNSNGGWGYISGKNSDPLTSAWVGFALDYQSPSPTDQAVLQNIQFLLDTQQTDGTWVTNSGKYSTRLATTSLVMAYLPIALDFLDSADLSISMMRLTENTDGTLSLSARIGNGGSDQLRTETSISFYDGNPAINGTLISEEDILSLEKWKYRDMVVNDISLVNNSRIYAVVDPRNWINECNELNNYMDIPASASKLYGQINVSTDKQSYRANETTLFTGVSTNLGKLEASLTAQLILEDDNGNVVQNFDPVDLGIVASQESRIISSDWNTTTTLAGEYILKGILTDSNGNVVDESTTSFSIVNDDIDGVSATLDISTDRLRYHTTDTVLISNFIESLSVNSIISEARVELQIVDANGSVVNTQTLTQGDLLPSSTKEANTNYGYTRVPVGNYTIRAELYGNSDTLYASDTATFEVYEDLTQALKGTVSLAWYSQLAGADQTCDYSVTNFGSTALQGLPIELRVMDLNRSIVVQTFAGSVDINTTNTVEDTETFTTNGYEAGDYSCALYAQTGREWTLLAHEQFTVEVPPIIIEATIEQQGKGRLLILLDPCIEKHHCRGHSCCAKGSKGSQDSKNYQKCSSSRGSDKGSKGSQRGRYRQCKEANGPQDGLAHDAQRDYLEKLLTRVGYAYTVITEADTFTDELRSGGYDTYLLLSETVKLSTQIQKELREAVYSGDSLLVSGIHDNRNKYLEDIVGIDYKGHHYSVETVEIVDANYSYFEEILMDHSQAIRFESENDRVLARYNLSRCKGKDTNAAIAYKYGKGESIFVGFDLLVEASKDPLGNYEQLFVEILRSLNKGKTVWMPYEAIPMTLTVSNLGIETPVRTEISLSDNAEFIDVLDVNESNATQLTFIEPLMAEDTEVIYAFWVRALLGTQIEVNAEIYSLLDDKVELQTSLNKQVSLISTSDYMDVLVEVESIALESKKDRKALQKVMEYLEKSQNYIEKEKDTKALEEMLKATDRLMKIDEANKVKMLRVMIDQLIRELEIRINQGEK